MRDCLEIVEVLYDQWLMEEFHPQSPIRVDAETYSNEYFILAKDLYFFRRRQVVAATKEEVDAFGHFWALAVADLKPGQVSVRRGEDWVEVVGPKLIWLPPHAVVHWRLGPGPLEWYSYLSSTVPPAGLPGEPTLFTSNEFFWPKSTEEIARLFTQTQNMVALTPSARNPWALKLKRRLDLEYNQNLRIEDYAEHFGLAHETLTRAFHEEFGLPPIQYRNKMRLMQAMVDILMTGKRISEISQAVGFKDQSHFHQLFRREIRSKPSRFRI